MNDEDEEMKKEMHGGKEERGREREARERKREWEREGGRKIRGMTSERLSH